MKTNKIYSCAPTKKRFKVIIKQNYTVRTFFDIAESTHYLISNWMWVWVKLLSFLFRSSFSFSFIRLRFVFLFFILFENKNDFDRISVFKNERIFIFAFLFPYNEGKICRQSLIFWGKKIWREMYWKVIFWLKTWFFPRQKLSFPDKCWVFTENSLQQWTGCSLGIFQCRLMW